MKTPICNIDIRSGFLCSRCQDKLDRGLITQLDIDIAKELLSLEDKTPGLKDIEFKKAVDTGSMVIIIIGKGNVPEALGSKGKAVKELEKRFNKKFRVIEENSNIRKTIEDMVTPAALLGINTLWLPDGSLEKKVRIRVDDSKKLPTDIRVLEEAVKSLTGERIRIVFE
jgi:transcription antitermination factor NusA-like protein